MLKNFCKLNKLDFDSHLIVLKISSKSWKKSLFIKDFERDSQK